METRKKVNATELQALGLTLLTIFFTSFIQECWHLLFSMKNNSFQIQQPSLALNTELIQFTQTCFQLNQAFYLDSRRTRLRKSPLRFYPSTSPHIYILNYKCFKCHYNLLIFKICFYEYGGVLFYYQSKYTQSNYRVFKLPSTYFTICLSYCVHKLLSPQVTICLSYPAINLLSSYFTICLSYHVLKLHQLCCYVLKLSCS